MDKILEEIREKEFSLIRYNEESEDYYSIIPGSIPILLSAPHGAKHFRKYRWKGEDEYTSSLAIKLGELTGAHVIYVKNKTLEDPNYMRNTRYKDAIKKIIEDNNIRFVADIHGANKKLDFKIDVGIISEDLKECSCPKLKDLIEESFKGFQEPLFNLKFPAGSPGTVTYFVKSFCNTEAAQFEINGKYRIIRRKPDSTKALEGEPEYKAREKNILEMIKRLENMINKIKDDVSQQ